MMPEKIKKTPEGLSVPNHPEIAFMEGDGIGPEVMKAAKAVLDRAVERAYGKEKSLVWKKLSAGGEAVSQGKDPLPPETLSGLRESLVTLKGPLQTPVGKGHRSLNVRIRQELDLFACVRPVRYFEGIAAPVKRPEAVDMVIFRENTEDVYAGMELEAGSPQTEKLRGFVAEEFGWNLSEETGLGLKPVSRRKSERLIRSALRYALQENRRSLTLVHKGNIMKYTEGAFLNWGLEMILREEGHRVFFEDEKWENRKTEEQKKQSIAAPLLIKSVIADAFFQESLLHPEEFDVMATLNLNGDYISDALAAQTGGIGMAPGANINEETGAAVFEATHGIAPKLAGRDRANPSSVILSGVMLLRYLGRDEAAELVEKSLAALIQRGEVTEDLFDASAFPGKKPLSCSGFGRALEAEIKESGFPPASSR